MLPDNLPDDIIHAINMEFGEKLMEYLTRLMADSKSMRGHSKSLTSERLSIDSHESRPIEPRVNAFYSERKDDDDDDDE